MKFSSVHVLVWSVLGVALTGAVELPKLPDNHVTCYRDDPEFNRCFKTTLQNLCRAFITRGIPEFQMIPFDPLRIPNIIVNYNQFALNSKLNLSAITAVGFEHMQIRGVRSYFHNRTSFRMNVDTYVSKLFIKSDHYDAQAHFLYQPVNEQGFYNHTVGGVNGTWKLYGTPMIKDDGETYIKLNRVDYQPKLQTSKFYASNLYSANKDLNDAILVAIDSFWPIFYYATLRDFSSSWGALMTDYLNNMFLNVPYNTMFPLRNTPPQQKVPSNSVNLYRFGTILEDW